MTEIHRPPPVPSLSDLKRAHDIFLEREARDLFYIVATDLVRRALMHEGPVDLGAAVAVLLATWNRRFYQRGRRCDRHHVEAISRQLDSDGKQLLAFRNRSIDTLVDQDFITVESLFGGFEPLLGPVGVTKCFHLLAPRFFPLWDNAIAKAYRLPLSGWANSQRYVKFLKLVARQLEQLGGETIEAHIGTTPLKALDEYNYCVGLGWLPRPS